MGAWLSERCKIDAAIEYQILATPAPGIISRYFRMDKYCKAVFVVTVDTMAAAAQVVCNLFGAAVRTGVGGAAIAGGTCTITANTNATVVTVTLATVLALDTVTINGVIFTAGAAPDFPNLVFDMSGADAADAASLAACINAAAGQAALLVAGGHITATVLAGAVVTLTVSEAGSDVMTVTSVGGTMTVATVQAIAYIEAEDTAAATPASEWMAIQLIGAATSHASVVCIRGGASRYNPTQQVAASDTDE